MFTTRPDTIFGATYMVIAPEHPLLEGLASSAQQAAVQQYVADAAQKSDLERTELQKVKSGVDTGQLVENLHNRVHPSHLVLWQERACTTPGSLTRHSVCALYCQCIVSSKHKCLAVSFLDNRICHLPRDHM